MNKKPTNFERIIIKMIVFHFFVLLISQWLLTTDMLFFQLNKTFLYEGVHLETETKTIETFDR